MEHRTTVPVLDQCSVAVLTYEDLPSGTTDATVIALCERLGLSEVATLDRRHFTVVRPRHVEAFTPLPEVTGPGHRSGQLPPLLLED